MAPDCFLCASLQVQIGNFPGLFPILLNILCTCQMPSISSALFRSECFISFHKEPATSLSSPLLSFPLLLLDLLQTLRDAEVPQLYVLRE